MLIDTHCHLDTKYFPEGEDAVLARARAAGVMAFVSIGVGSLEQTRNAVELAHKDPRVVATVGVHPHDAAEHDEAKESELLELLSRPRVTAVGEIGLDYHYDHSPRAVQERVFRRFIQIALSLGKPIVVHTRSAAADTLRILEEERARDVGGVIHCFSEDRAFAERALDLGFDLSFSGIVTFKNAVAIQDVARFAPSDRIMVETDSPYLAPIPYRGKPNEPAFVLHTAQKIAELRQTTVDDVSALTTANAVRRFGDQLAQALSAGQNSAE